MAGKRIEEIERAIGELTRGEREERSTSWAILPSFSRELSNLPRSSGATRRTNFPDGNVLAALVLITEETTSQWMVPQNDTADSQDFWSCVSEVIKYQFA